MSLRRPAIHRWPSSSRQARSPVCHQPLRHLRRGLRRTVAVATADERAAHDEFTDLPGFERPARLVHDAHLHAVRLAADRADLAQAVLGGQEGRHRAAFGAAVVVDELDIGKALDRAPHHRHRRRFAAGDDQAQAAQVELGVDRRGQHALEHRRVDRDHRAALLGNGRQQALRVELARRPQHHPPAAQQQRQCQVHQRSGMEQRPEDHRDVLRREGRNR